jgi:putative salt-induced outer membrane protein YdiY
MLVKSSAFKWSVLFTLMLGVVSLRAQTVTNAPPKPKWVGDVSAGVTLTRGNSDTTLANLTANIDRKTDINELLFGGNATYGKAKVTVNNPTPGGAPITASSTTAQNADGFFQYNQLFTPRFYGYARVEGYHDDVADIHYRLTIGPGAGYYFIKNARTSFSAEAGPAYISQDIGSEKQNFVTLRVAEKFTFQLSDRAHLWENAEIDPDLQNTKSYIVTSEFGVAADLTAHKNLSLNVFLDDDYESEPAPGREKNDAKLVAAIDYKF